MPKSTWFITGTSSGLGLALTETLVARGHRVAATARKPETLDHLTEKYGSSLWRAALDVTDSLAAERVVDRASADLGTIDVIVNNAGYGLFGGGRGVH